MKVHFIAPPPLNGKPIVDRIYGCNFGLHPLPNIFVLHSATLLQENGYEVEVTDCPIDGMLNPKQFYKFIDEDKSDLYVIYSVFLTGTTDKIAAEYIQSNKDVPYIFAGPDPTYDPTGYLTNEESYVIRGEPELTLLKLVQAIEDDKNCDAVRGISYLNGASVKHNEMRPLLKNLDILPIPDRRLLKNPHKYYDPKLPRMHTLAYTSRNCPFTCYYCVPCSLSFARELEYKRHHKRKPPVAFHSTQRVIEEFKVIENQGYKSVAVVDDNFTLGKERIIDICNGIKELNLQWICLGRADQLLDEKLIKAMSDAGCVSVSLGIEHFCQSILDDIEKNLKVEFAEKAIKLLKKNEIEPQINVLFGASPLETEDTIIYTLKRVRELRRKYRLKYVLFNACSPFPGTSFYTVAKEKGWMVYEDYKPIDGTKESQIGYPHLSKEKIEYYLKKAYREHYFNLRFGLNELLSIKEWGSLGDRIEVAKKLFKYYILDRRT